VNLFESIMLLAKACQYDTRIVATKDAKAGELVTTETIGMIGERIMRAEEELRRALVDIEGYVPTPPHPLNVYFTCAVGNFSNAPDEVFEGARRTVEEMEIWARACGVWDDE
jgi:hypothetical protein